MQWVFFVCPCVVRYFEGGIVFLSLAGSIPESTERRCVGVGFRQLVVIVMISFRDTSSFLTWELRLHTGVAYSAPL